VARTLALCALVVLLAGGCGGGGDTAEEASQAVASLIASDDCLKLQEVSVSVQRALGGAVSADLGSQALFLADVATRAPREISGDLTVVQGALSALAQGQVVAEPQAAGVRGAAERLGAWARTSCPG
jgi:hypothetical protein